MTSLGEIANLVQSYPIESMQSRDLFTRGMDVRQTEVEMQKDGDLYRYAGAKKHEHIAVPD